MALRVKIIAYEAIGSPTPDFKSIAKIWIYDQDGNKVPLTYSNVIYHNYASRTAASYINDWFNDNNNPSPPYNSNDLVGVVEIQLPDSVTAVSFITLMAWPNVGGAGKALAYLSDDEGYDYQLQARFIFNIPSEQVTKQVGDSSLETIKIGGSTQSFVKVLYVDPENGNDMHTGSAGSPLKTISAAVDKCEHAGYAIYALQGTHDVTHVSSGNGTGGLYDAGKSISFIGVPGYTTFLCDGVVNTRRDHHAVSTFGPDTKLYQLTFDVKLGGRTYNYQTAVFGRDSNFTKCKVYNCVFLFDGRPSIVHDNAGANVIEVYNSTFITTDNFLPSSGGGARPKLVNCVSNFAFYNEGTRLTCAGNLVFSPTYMITSDESLWKDVGTGLDLDGSPADLGIYGGMFRWQSDAEIIIDPDDIDVHIPKNTDHIFDFQIKSPTPFHMTEETEMLQATLGTGQVFVGTVNLKEWVDIALMEVK